MTFLNIGLATVKEIRDKICENVEGRFSRREWRQIIKRVG